MHCIISWDIEAENQKWTQLNEELKKCFLGYSWVKPLSTFYIVKVDNTDERDSIKESLTKICIQNPKTINFIISPAIEGSGTYSGWLPKTFWPKIKDRTEEDSNEL